VMKMGMMTRRRKKSDHYFDDERFDMLKNTVQNQHKRFKSNHAYDDDSSFIFTDEDEQISYNNDNTPSVPPLTGGKQGGCKKKQSQLVGKTSSFEKRFNELEAYQAKYGHCNVKQSGDNKSLGRWCSKVRQSVEKMQNNEAPIFMGLSEENIQRLEDIGFDFNPEINGKSCSSFEKRFSELEAYQAKYGHCNVKQSSGNYKSLGQWCSKVRQSVKKMQNNEAPIVAGLSEENIQRLEGIGFDCNPKINGKSCSSFEKRFSELEAYKAKYGHCNVKQSCDNKSLGHWCSKVRRSMGKMQNNEAPIVAGLSEENIQRLEDIGFDCNSKK